MNTKWTEADVMAHNARLSKNKERYPGYKVDFTKPPGERFTPVPKASKYRNIKTVVDGITFDSKREAQYWAELKLRENIGDICLLRRQVPYPLWAPHEILGPNGTIQHELFQVGTYVADFVFLDSSGKTHVQDVKGGKATKTALYRWKVKHLELQDGIQIEEV